MNTGHLPTESSRTEFTHSTVGDRSVQIEAEQLAELLHDIEIWSDLHDEGELRRVLLPTELTQVRYFDAATGDDIAEMSDSTGRPFSVYDVADVLTYHVDYRGRTWLSTSVKSLGAHTLDLLIEFSA